MALVPAGQAGGLQLLTGKALAGGWGCRPFRGREHVWGVDRWPSVLSDLLSVWVLECQLWREAG